MTKSNQDHSHEHLEATKSDTVFVEWLCDFGTYLSDPQIVDSRTASRYNN